MRYSQGYALFPRVSVEDVELMAITLQCDEPSVTRRIRPKAGLFSAIGQHYLKGPKSAKLTHGVMKQSLNENHGARLVH